MVEQQFRPVVVISLLLAIAGVVWAIVYWARLLSRTRVHGVVVDFDKSSEDDSLFPIIEYRPGGGEPMRVRCNGNDKAQLGQPWVVYYEPRAPERATAHSRIGGYVVPLVFVLVGLGMAAVTTLLVRYG
jgi:hypothetical protein